MTPQLGNTAMKIGLRSGCDSTISYEDRRMSATGGYRHRCVPPGDDGIDLRALGRLHGQPADLLPEQSGRGRRLWVLALLRLQTKTQLDPCVVNRYIPVRHQVAVYRPPDPIGKQIQGQLGLRPGCTGDRDAGSHHLISPPTWA